MPLDDRSTSTVASTSGRDGSVRSALGFIDQQVKGSEQDGGTVRRTSPEEFFAAAFAACTDASGPRLTLSDMLSMMQAQSDGD